MSQMDYLGELKERKLPPFVYTATDCKTKDVQVDNFKKFDTGKLRYDLFPNNVLVDVIKVMMYGAFTKGYGVDNWKMAKSQEDITRYYNACRRHIEAYREGEYFDSESRLQHLAHAICNIMFMHYLEEEKRNDRDSQTKSGNS